MKKVSIILTAAFGLILAACSVDSDIESQKESLYTETITVCANRDGVDVNGPDGTRARLYRDNTLKSVWEAGDQLTVWTGNEFSEENMSEGGFTLDSGAGTNSATFAGKVKSTLKPNKTTVLTAVVDNDDDAVDCSSGSTIALDFSVQQGCTTADVLRYDALWAQATYAKRDFRFTHAMSYVEWTIKINGITAATMCDITLSATGMQNMAELDLAEGALSGTNEGDITLQDVSIDANGEAVIYVALFPGLVASKITATITMGDGSVTAGQLGTFDSFTFQPNTLYTAAWAFGAPAAPTYTFTATSPEAIAYNETATGDYTVTSYATVGSTKQPVSWTVTKYEYSDDGGTTWTDNGIVKPSWLSALSLESGSGSTDGENGTATVTAAGIVYLSESPVNSLLKAATPKTNYDLSQGGETANCYVISAPGSYKIPLIYGNARNANGTENSACFNNTKPYVNYKGTAITNMWLKTDGTPTTGELVWKDVSTDIVTDLAVSSDQNFLTFTVTKDNLVQGNAVVAVKDNEGQIMWSWHLWFTDPDALSTIAFNNANGETEYITRDNLGYVIDTYNGTSYTIPRRVRVTVTQAGSNQTTQFQVIHNAYIENITFHDTKYQFGRKDAFSGVTTGAPTIVLDKTTYQNSILNPGTFNTYKAGYYNWCSVNLRNAWDVSNSNPAGYGGVSTRDIVKSVYDPCPAGFKMPGSKAFTGFPTKPGVNATWTSLGYTFIDSSNGTSVFFPVTDSYQYNTGELISGDSSGYYWSAVANPNSGDTAYGMYFTSTNVKPQEVSLHRRAAGMSVRPVKNR